MKSPVFYLLLFLLLFLADCPIIAQEKSIELEKVDALLEQYMEQYQIPAISLGFIHEGDTYFLNKGIYKRGQDKIVDIQASYQIASLSKTFTGIIFKELIADQIIKAEEPILKYLPADYAPKIKKKLAGITIQDMLHHRSGFPRDSKIARGKRKGNDPLIYDYPESDFERDFQLIKIKKNSKEAFEYSNFAYAVLGYIAERASGKSFEKLLQEYICQPYDLTNTSTKVPDQKVTPYYKEDRFRETQHWVLGKLTPPSGIFSCSEDLIKLLGLQLSIYKKKDLSHALYLTEDSRPETGPAYGYGLFDWGNGGYGHGGDVDGYACNYWLNPDKIAAYIMLTSSGGSWVQAFSLALEKMLLED